MMSTFIVSIAPADGLEPLGGESETVIWSWKIHLFVKLVSDFIWRLSVGFSRMLSVQLQC